MGLKGGVGNEEVGNEERNEEIGNKEIDQEILCLLQI